MLGEKGAKELCQEILARAGDAQVEVVATARESALTRFANNSIHQNVAEKGVDLNVRVCLGTRTGSASTNRTDDIGLDWVIDQARHSAAASLEDPHFAGLAEPAEYQQVKAFDDATAAYSPHQRASAVAEVCRLASERSLNAFGAFSTRVEEITLANSQGLFAYYPFTQADFQTTVMAEDASGRAQASDWRAGEIDIRNLGQEAIRKADSGRGPRSIQPGEYAVIFDPYVAEDILGSLNFYGMSAMAVQEGRSWMNDRIGQKMMSDQVSVKDDGLDPAGTPMPFDYEGTPKQRVDIIREGVILGPVYDRYTAQKTGVASTGHALPPEYRNFGPLAANLFMAPGEASVEEMIRATERGLYITRFWYTRLVHPRDCVITGMTRDGVFMIEHGELAYPVKNLRFTQSYVQALADVELVGRERRQICTEFGPDSFVVPALKIGRFNFTGITV